VLLAGIVRHDGFDADCRGRWRHHAAKVLAAGLRRTPVDRITRLSRGNKRLIQPRRDVHLRRIAKVKLMPSAAAAFPNTYLNCPVSFSSFRRRAHRRGEVLPSAVPDQALAAATFASDHSNSACTVWRSRMPTADKVAMALRDAACQPRVRLQRSVSKIKPVLNTAFKAGMSTEPDGRGPRQLGGFCARPVTLVLAQGLRAFVAA